MNMQTKIDVLRFLSMPDISAKQRYNRQQFGLGSAFDIITPIVPLDSHGGGGYGQWKHVKSYDPQPGQGGFAWDFKLYDNDAVYDWITEDTWQGGPRNYKKFVQNHRKDMPSGTLLDGVVQFPRWIDPVDCSFDNDCRDTNYIRYADCKAVTTPRSLGPVHVRLRGPFLIDHGLVDEHGVAIGEVPTIIYQYYWSNNPTGVPGAAIATLEENAFALDYGWVSWKLQEQDKTTGLYVKKQTTLNNKIVKFTHPYTANFPCF